MHEGWEDLKEEDNLAACDKEGIVRLDDPTGDQSLWQKDGITRAKFLTAGLNSQGEAECP
jgi:hypothetical protein